MRNRDARTTASKADSRTAIPIAGYAVDFGVAPFVLHSRVRVGSLPGAATQKGIRVLLYEAGEAFRFDPRASASGSRGPTGSCARWGW
jgi:hypothetical protein